jgi:hypothetical protein
VGPRAVLDAVVKRKIPNPRRESNPRTQIVQPVAQRYTEFLFVIFTARNILNHLGNRQNLSLSLLFIFAAKLSQSPTLMRKGGPLLSGYSAPHFTIIRSFILSHNGCLSRM